MRRYSLPAILFLWGMATTLILPMGPDASRIPGGPDSRLNSYFLEHGYQWLTGGLSGFADAPFFYPARRAMTFSDAHFGTLPIYAAFRAAGAGRDESYQLWLIAVFALNFAACAWILFRSGLGPAGAGAGAFIFTFSMPVVAQIVHSQLLPRYAVPIAFYSAWRWAETGKIKYQAAMCAAVVYQLYCGFYTGFLLALSIPFLFLAMAPFRLARGGAAIRPGSAAKAAGVFAVAAAAATPFALFYLSSPLGPGGLDREGMLYFIPSPASWLLPAKDALIWNFLEPAGKLLKTTEEHRIFPGAIPPLALIASAFAALAALFRRRPGQPGFAAACSIMTIALAALSLQVAGASPWLPLSALPGFTGIRAVSRIALIMSFPFALATGAAIDGIAAAAQNIRPLENRRWAAALAAVFMSGAVAIDQFVPPSAMSCYSKPDSQKRALAIVEKVKSAGPGIKAFYYAPLDSSVSPIERALDAMSASQISGVPTVNGYSGRYPRGYFFQDYPKSDAPLKRWILEWRGSGPPETSCEQNPFNGLLVIQSDQAAKSRVLRAACQGAAK